MPDLMLGRLALILEDFLHRLQLQLQVCTSPREQRHLLTVGRCISLSLHHIHKQWECSSEATASGASAM